MRARRFICAGLLFLFVTAPAAGQIAASRLGSAAPGSSDSPINVSGHEFIYDYKTDTFIARGDALLTQDSGTLKADEIQWDRRQQRARAQGNVHLTDPDVEMIAKEAQLDLPEETGRLVDAQVTAAGGNYRLAGAEISKGIGQSYSVRDGYFTTCGCAAGTPDWSIGAKQLDVHLGDVGTAHDAHFNVLDYPILSLPYAIFPADTSRHSGLLSPRFGQSRLRGFQYLQPYFIAIDKSSDLTIAPDIETSARIGALSEYRLASGTDDYLRVTGGFFDEHIRGNRNDDVVDDQLADPHVPVDRYGLIGLTREHITPDLTIYGDAISVSDSLYLREMNVYTLSRGYGENFAALREAIAHFGILQSFDNSFLRAQGEWHQDLIQPQDLALQTLPEVLWSGRQELPGRIGFSDFDAQTINYWRQDGIGGARLDLNPRITLPVRLGDYLYGYGTGGVRETMYDVSGHNIAITPVGSPDAPNNNALSLGPLGAGGFRTRELIYGGAGVSSEIEKVYDLDWDGIEKVKHTIEPMVNYSYVPTVNQSQLPLFDGTDRVEPRSLVGYGLVSRLFIKTAPSEEQPPAREDDNEDSGDAGFAPQSTYASSGGVRELLRLELQQAYDTIHLLSPDGSHLSDVDLNTTLFPTNVLSFLTQLDYNPHQQQITFVNSSLNFRPPWVPLSTPRFSAGHAVTGPFLQIGYTFVGGPNASHAISVRAYYELFDRLGLFYAPAYDFANHQMLSAEYGFRLKSTCDCWSIDTGITNTINPSETQVLFQVTLGGLGSIGRNPFGRNPFTYGSGGGILPGTAY